MKRADPAVPSGRAPVRRSVWIAGVLVMWLVAAGGWAWQAYRYLGSAQGAIDAAVLGTLIVAGGLVWLRLRTRLGSVTAIAAISAGVAALVAVLAATLPLCHGTALATDAAGGCEAAGVAQWVLTAAAAPWVVALPLAVAVVTGKLTRSVWRFSTAAWNGPRQLDNFLRNRLGPVWGGVQRWARMSAASAPTCRGDAEGV